MSATVLQEQIEKLLVKYQSFDDGTVASYIPELSLADPNDFGIAIATVDGNLFKTGNSDRLFTIQSISKPFTYGMALEIFGADKVSRHVGVEPSGDAFNSIELEKGTNRPFNPMVNAGAITVTALLYEHFGESTFDRILERFSAAAGRQLSIDEKVYRSESSTGHRNRAIAYLLLNFGMIGENVEAALDVYFRQCSILVNCEDLANIGATIANLGTNPHTKEQVFDIDRVKDIQSIMMTCGMYDYSGQWAYKVGVPAKSGVSGGVLSIINRQLAIATYSPRLDAQGNSCRGIKVSEDLANEFGLHAFDCMNLGSAYLKSIL